MPSEAEGAEPQSAGAAVPVYFGTGGRTLFGWYHAVDRAVLAVTICSPLGNESTGWHRASRHWAEAMARAGIAVLRFDYDGTGDSLGDMNDSNRLRAWTESVTDAVNWLRAASGAPRQVAVGIRLGGTLALAAAVEGAGVDGLVLWAPFPSGRAFLREGRAFSRLMGPSIDTDSTSDSPIEQFGGLALMRETVRELAEFDPLGAARLLVPVLLIPREEGASDAPLRERLEAAGASVQRKALDGYASVITDAHQGEIPHAVIDGTISWLVEHFVGSAEAAPQLSVTEGLRTAAATVAVTADGVSERMVQFGTERLCGVMSVPSLANRRRTGILLVNSGAVYRVGPNRLHVTLSRRWAALGYTVLRMDIGGLGDSPVPTGGIENTTYPPHAVRDVETGIAALRAEGVERVVVGGMCSGAHTTFHAALQLQGINGVIMLNPIVFYWKPSDPLDVGAWRIFVESRYYKQSARRWSSWRKVLAGRVNLLYVARVAWRRAGEILRAKGSALGRRLLTPSVQMENAAHDLERITRNGTDLLLLFSEGDPGHDFLTLNYANELRHLQRLPRFRMYVIPDADHTFTTLDARQRVSEALTDYLLDQHP